MEYIYTCNCLLEQMIQMTVHEIEDSIDTFEIFSLSRNYITLLFQEKCLYLFCTDLALFTRRFSRSDVCCMRRENIDDFSCLQTIEMGTSLCYNCTFIFAEILRKVLVKLPT